MWRYMQPFLYLLTMDVQCSIRLKHLVAFFDPDPIQLGTEVYLPIWAWWKRGWGTLLKARKKKKPSHNLREIYLFTYISGTTNKLYLFALKTSITDFFCFRCVETTYGLLQLVGFSNFLVYANLFWIPMEDVFFDSGRL